MPDACNSCPHSYVKKLNIESWIYLKQKCNVKMKIECAMRNEQINDLVINYSFYPNKNECKFWTLKK